MMISEFARSAILQLTSTKRSAKRTTRRAVGLAVLATALLAFGQAAVAQQDTMGWLAGTGDWFAAANWRVWNRLDPQGNILHIVPGASDNAGINNGGTAQIAGGSAAASSLLIYEYSALNISSGSFVTREIIAGASFSGGTSTDGTITQTGGSVVLTDGASYLGSGAGSHGVYNLSNGTLTVANVYGILVGGSGVGDFNQSGGAHHAQTLYMGIGATGRGGYLLSNGLLEITGRSTSSACCDEVIGQDGAGVFTQTGGTHTVAGTLTVALLPGSAGDFNLLGGSLDAGALVINANGTFTNAASLSLHGASTSGIINGGEFTQLSSGTLSIRIGGIDEAEYGYINVGHADLAGVLNVTFAPGYTPPIGNYWSIMNFLTMSGRFDRVSLPPLSPGLIWKMLYEKNCGVVALVILEDSDGDGIPDDWEATGVPYCDANRGVQRYRLQDIDPVPPDPMRKDIYVEVDSMSGQSPSDAAMQAVVQAFAQAPVPNVYGGVDHGNGVTLHIIKDSAEQNISASPAVLAGNPWSEFITLKQDHFGSSSDGNGADRIGRLDARAKVVRYCLFADRWGVVDQSGATRYPSGCAATIPGNDFFVTLGAVSATNRTDRVVEGTFMHELGHTLGLHHGGDVDTNYKPNYYSVMNYWWQMPNSWAGWRLDYSREVLPTLQENQLSEVNGIGAGSAVYPTLRVPFTVNTSARVGFAPLRGIVDWDGNGQRGEPGTFHININNGPSDPSSSDVESLNGFEDWPALQYALAFRTGYADVGAAGVSPPSELDDQTMQWLASIPPPPPLCAADFDDGTGTGTPDGGVTLDDLLYYLDIYGAGIVHADVDDGSGTGTPDGGVTVEDLLFFLDHFAAGC